MQRSLTAAGLHVVHAAPHGTAAAGRTAGAGR